MSMKSAPERQRRRAITLGIAVALLPLADGFSPARSYYVRRNVAAPPSSPTALHSDPLSAPSPAASVSQRKKKLKTFQRYLEVECWRDTDLRPLEPVLQAVSDGCKQINRIVQRAKTDDLYGAAVDRDGNALEENIQGEVQQKLDVVCNDIMLGLFCGSSDAICAVASEEEDLPRTCADVMVSY